MILYRFHFASFALLLLFLSACGGSRPSAPPKEYTLNGVVLRVDPQVRTAVIKHEKIDGWMEAMTMEFPVHDAKEFEKLAAGKQITATVYVTDDGYWIGNIRPGPSGGGPSGSPAAGRPSSK
jgi:Cu/Ag efflux protein CusF